MKSGGGPLTLTKDYERCYELASIFPEQTDSDEVKFFASLVSSKKALNILDIGSAEGKLAVLLAQNGHHVTALDISKNFLDQTRAASERAGVKLETVCCNIESDNPAIPGGPFDAIYFMDVIEHLKNPVKALENIRALMANDGMLIIHTPNVYRPGTFLRYLISGPGAFARGIGSTPDFHFQTYDYLTLEKTLEFVGLRVAEVVPTRMTFPVIGKFGRLRRTGAWKAGSRLASKRWPFLSDTLLVVCTKTDPVDINSWVEQRKVREGDSPQSG